MSHLAIATHHDDRPESRGHNAGGDLIALAPGVDLPGVVSSYDRDEEIFAEEEAATHVYKVLSGAVRVTRLLSDGRRHIARSRIAPVSTILRISPIRHTPRQRPSAGKISAARSTT